VVIDGTPAAAHQARNSTAAQAQVRRVCGLRMLAAKNLRKRIEARSPAAATSAGRMVGPQRLMIACPVTAHSRFSKTISPL
jgi:hypothetical protein